MQSKKTRAICLGSSTHEKELGQQLRSSCVQQAEWCLQETNKQKNYHNQDQVTLTRQYIDYRQFEGTT